MTSPYEIRELEIKDYHKGFLDLLEELTEVGCVSYTQFKARFRNQNSVVFVMEDNNTIIATASIFIERKYIHQCASVGHIEDVVVSNKYRGLKLGQIMIDHLVTYARKQGCYKVILNCEDKNVEFYKKCGFSKSDIEMSYYFVPKSKL